MDNQVKLLIVRFSSIGDIVLTTPIVRCVKQQMEGEVVLHYLTKVQYKNILENNPHIDKVYSIKKSTSEVMDELLDEKYDFIIDLHKNLRSSAVKSRLKGFSFTFKKYNIEKWLLVNFGINRLPDIHLVDRYFEAVKALGIENDGKGLDYFIPESEEVNPTEFGPSFSGDYIALSIGGKFSGKKLSDKKLVELCRMLKYPIVALGGKEDELIGELLSQSIGEKGINACGKYSLNQSASILKQAKLVITHDTGLMHIAAAFKKHIISIWGATVPEFGMYPYLAGDKSVIIQADHLKYRPTSKLGNRNTKKEIRTMEEIDLQKVVKAADEVMKG